MREQDVDTGRDYVTQRILTVTVIMNRVGIEEEKGIEEKSMLPSIFKDGY